ncbi:YeeE/YedE thiosulfate transporter family protein [Dethiosulfovibrio peptidovorans]|uniref:YeeE/YedE thiosulfate transporter family protein n=1 Tax=Dethiosulfovibrio peptidovorans TaxID=47055 RepID=UPI00019E65DB|nr:YeeE/YedE thiosulfate transporter family protein [Dethiosulfovibrio peptidovorans]
MIVKYLTRREVRDVERAKRSTRKKKANQLPIALLLLVVIVAVGFYLSNFSPSNPSFWFFGILLGLTLRASRFCFTASMRDPVLTGGTNLTKAVIVAIALATVGFAAIQYKASLTGQPIPGNISPVGVHIAIGAFMFGIGMVIAGGCASGTLMRVGEGFSMQWLSLVFFIVGSVWGARDFNYWKPTFIDGSVKIFLPDVLGWFPALVVQFGLLMGLFILADWFSNRKSLEK